MTWPDDLVEHVAWAIHKPYCDAPFGDPWECNCTVLAGYALDSLATAPGVEVEHAIEGDFLGRIPTRRVCTEDAARATLAEGDLVLDARRHVSRVCLPWQEVEK